MASSTEFDGEIFSFEITNDFDDCYPANVLLWSCHNCHKIKGLTFANEINLLKFNKDDFKIFLDEVTKQQSCEFRTFIWDDKENIPLVFKYCATKNELLYTLREAQYIIAEISLPMNDMIRIELNQLYSML